MLRCNKSSLPLTKQEKNLVNLQMLARQDKELTVTITTSNRTMHPSCTVQTQFGNERTHAFFHIGIQSRVFDQAATANAGSPHFKLGFDQMQKMPAWL